MLDKYKYDFLVVGVGFFGAVVAYRATKAGKKVLVVDRRNHIGGNAYCSEMNNIIVHQYGPHIFHTDNKRVWDFVNSLSAFNRFTNSPLAFYKGVLYNLPFNMNTFAKMWGVNTPDEALKILDRQRAEALNNLSDREPENLEEQALTLVGKDIYEKLIKGYTEKQWGRPCSELPAFIIKRLPVRLTFDNNYFNDIYQGIPVDGYNPIFEKLLADCDVRLNTDFIKCRSELRDIARTIIYSGAIDEYFDYRFGHLQYRSLKFETETLNVPNFQGNAVVNYTDVKVPYTRIIEHKHFFAFGEDVYRNADTVITKEYPAEWKQGMEPYYPINNEDNNALYKMYAELATTEKNVVFGGRLAEYKYYDMDDIIDRALSVDLGL
ncbi:MAG: UDP-galactopyranose mutase [Candidatus Aphodosoma sp.]